MHVHACVYAHTCVRIVCICLGRRKTNIVTFLMKAVHKQAILKIKIIYAQ